jgi:hypothetical protein
MPIPGYEYQSDFARQYLAEGDARGYARGRAESLFAVCAARGLTLTDAQRARVRECTDAATLDRWIRHAVGVGDAAAVFEQASLPNLAALMADRRCELQSNLARTYVAEGEARGQARARAESLVAVYAARGLAPTERSGTPSANQPGKRAALAPRIADTSWVRVGSRPT